MFKQQLGRRLKALEPNEKLVLGCLDINNFKELNNTLGYEGADLFLIELSNAIGRFARPGAIIGRLPPDQFLATRQFTDSDSIQIRVQSYLDLFASVAQKMNVDVACRIGVAVYPDDGKTADELLAAASAAIVTAKKMDQQVCYHDRAISQAVTKRRAMLLELKAAVQNNDFHLVYQPQYSIDTQEICGAETLIRWEHAEHGFIAPDEFIPLAEESGIMHEITKFVLSQCNTELSEAQLLGGVLRHVSVNISATEFNVPAQMKALQEHLQTLGQLSKRIRLEITETATLRDFEQSCGLIDELRSQGISVSIDDFGTGYTSLAMLKDASIDEIKIDRSFVDSIQDGQRSKTIVRAIIAMARSFNINIVAEGVETQQQLDLLKDLGCIEAQGFLLGKPMPIEAFKQHVLQSMTADTH